MRTHLDLVEAAVTARRDGHRHALRDERSHERFGAHHRLAPGDERLEDGPALGEKLLRGEGHVEPLEDDARAQVGIAAHRVALDVPREGLAEPTDDGLSGFRVQAFGIEEDAVEIEEDVGAALGHRKSGCAPALYLRGVAPPVVILRGAVPRSLHIAISLVT